MSKKVEIRLELKIPSSRVSLSGREFGVKERNRLKLDEKDNDGNIYIIVIPDRIRTFNISYFLGLFSPSLKKLGESEFKNKYYFNQDGQELNEGIKSDIEEGILWATENPQILS